MAATLGVLWGGRLDLGLGWGSQQDELRTWGYGDATPAARARRLAETLELLPQLWSGEPVTWAGEHVQLDGAVSRPRPVNGRIPLHIGGGRRAPPGAPLPPGPARGGRPPHRPAQGAG